MANKKTENKSKVYEATKTSDGILIKARNHSNVIHSDRWIIIFLAITLAIVGCITGIILSKYSPLFFLINVVTGWIAGMFISEALTPRLSGGERS